MSQDASATSNKQAKKAQRDAERRKERGKKRKHDDDEDQAQQDGPNETVSAEATGGVVKKAKVSTTKKSPTEASEASAEPSNIAGDTATERPKKRKKAQSQTAAGDETKPSNSRFIVFIGNLPYTATDASVRLHFKKLEPFTLRHRVDPSTKRSKGFAFLEFENYDRMKTCLKLYHHSMFDPDAKEAHPGTGSSEGGEAGKATKPVSKKARRINVELTAGGGGKNENRSEKIKAKNVRLEEQRKRRAELEKVEKAKKEGKRRTGANAAPAAAKDAPEAAADGDDGGSIHPSRLARMAA